MIKEVCSFLAFYDTDNEKEFNIYDYTQDYYNSDAYTSDSDTDKANFKKGNYTNSLLNWLRETAKQAAEQYVAEACAFNTNYINFYDSTGTLLVLDSSNINYLTAREFYDKAAYVLITNDTTNGLKKEAAACEAFLGIVIPSIIGKYKYSKVNGWVEVDSIPET